MSDSTESNTMTLDALLGTVKGLGPASIEKALGALDINGVITTATPEQLARTAEAKDGKMNGLKGKALAMWIVTGKNSAEQATHERQRTATAGGSSTTASPTTSKPDEFKWPKPKAEILLDYLKSEVTADHNAPNRGAPFIDAKGIVRFTGTHWREWLSKQGMHPGKNEAGVPVRDAGLKMRPFALPGESRQLGFYTGPAPRGTASLPKRIVERAARGTGGGSTRKPASPFAKFTDEQVAYLRTVIAKGKKGTVKDELLALLPEPAQEPEPAQAQEPAQEPQEAQADDPAPEANAAPQEPSASA